MTDTDKVRLLFGPYTPPPLHSGYKTYCYLRGPVVITSWSDARFSWPRCRPIDARGGGSGLLLDDELARAVLHESALAVCYWWRVCDGAVCRWRRALAVTRTNNEGTRRLYQLSAEAGAAGQSRGKPLPPEQVEQGRRLNRELNLSRHLQPGYHGPRWTAEQLALLGTMPDEEVARRTGHSVNGVRVRRTRLGIVTACDGRKCKGRKA
jgi:hypothetical protein